MKLKQIIRTLPAMQVDMGGFPVKQALPTHQVEQVDPFLLIHHGQVKYSANRPAMSQGVGPHPHRGFSPVTFVIEGEVHHRDSRGNSQVAKAGEVQWMHAGMGIIHSERPSEKAASEKLPQEIIQLWINTPAAKKMDQPTYQHLEEALIPVVSDSDVTTKVITGNFEDIQGPFESQSPVQILWVYGTDGGKWSVKPTSGYTSSLYLIKGSVRIEGHGIVDKESLVTFSEEGDTVALEFSESAQFLWLSGEPIGEKLAQHGPFVMNTQTEIMEAMRDYQMGKMGILIEDEL